MFIYYNIIIFITIFFLSLNAYSSDLKNALKFFSDLKSLEADFVQIDSQGNQKNGTIFLKKPSMVKVEYPKEILLLQGKTLLYFNQELKEKTYIPIKQFPLYLLSKENFNLQKESTSLKTLKDKNYFYLYFKLLDDEYHRQWEVVFVRKPFILYSITIVSEGSPISIYFKNIFLNQPISDAIFDDFFLHGNY